MAIGDEALAAGMPLVNGNAAGSAAKIDDYINETRDFVSRAPYNPVPVAKGGTGAVTAAAARVALGITPAAIGAAATVHTHAQSDVTGLADALAAKAALADVQWVQDGNMTTSVYTRVLGGAYRVLYASSTGLLGWVSSSRRHKKNIKPAVVDPAAVLAAQLVTFQYKAAIDPDGITQHGLIAEQLDELGLDWLVDYGDDGPEGVRYDRLALALLPVVQHLNARLAALEERHAPAD